MPHYVKTTDRTYRLRVEDPKSLKRKYIDQTVEIPENIMKSERKIKLFLDRELALYADKVQNGEVIKIEKLTLDEFKTRWEKSYAKQKMGGNTRYVAKNIYTIYIQPTFGAMRMDKIKTLHIVEFMSDLKRKDGKPMATNTKNNIYKALKSLFDNAFKWNLISSNPMAGVDRPAIGKQEKKQMKQRKKTYTRTEVQAVILALYDLPERWRLYYIGILLGGFRRGEMLGLEWPLVDFEAGGLYIDKQITFDENGNSVEGELKTEESEAYIPMPKWYMEALKRFRLEWKKEKMLCKTWRGGTKQYVFHGGEGVKYYPNTPSLTWRRFLSKRELPHIRLHDLRHTTAMLLRESGSDLKQIQERLRHTKIGTTADIYTHESEIISREAADRLEYLNPQIVN